MNPIDLDSALILGLETSCDETAAAVVRGGREVLSSVVLSQTELHAEYRGVVPEIASRAHCEALVPVVRRALAEAGVEPSRLAGVAVGNRPGLIGPLLVGVAGAKALAWSLGGDRDGGAWGLPCVGVNHVHAHLLAGLIGPVGEVPAPCAFPAIGLVISGGHTSLYRCESASVCRRLGSTIDDAVGEAYDKVAAILGLPFPGGPSVDALARTGTPARPGFPLSRLGPDSLDFSFSGLKTAALYAFQGVPISEWVQQKRKARGEETRDERLSAADVAATFQTAAAEVLVLKLSRALERHADCRTVLIGGGVSANSLVRARLSELGRTRGVDLRLPRMAYCVDNAAMIAALGHAVLAERGFASDPASMTATPTVGE